MHCHHIVARESGAQHMKDRGMEARRPCARPDLCSGVSACPREMRGWRLVAIPTWSPAPARMLANACGWAGDPACSVRPFLLIIIALRSSPALAVGAQSACGSILTFDISVRTWVFLHPAYKERMWISARLRLAWTAPIGSPSARGVLVYVDAPAHIGAPGPRAGRERESARAHSAAKYVGGCPRSCRWLLDGRRREKVRGRMGKYGSSQAGGRGKQSFEAC
ncbi:hypothetical protein B0H10DRAFT_355949 [Mycena sp. CBHHK59/15]|nr:hypothetical protein B0H10DRAFT_355949 [Mycena sp. CBHHK59/15]